MQVVHGSTSRKLEAKASSSNAIVEKTGAGATIAQPGLAIDLRREELKLKAQPADRGQWWRDQLPVLRDQ
jgi:hypothetical protein